VKLQENPTPPIYGIFSRSGQYLPQRRPFAGVELAMLEKLRAFAKSESGATSIEYGLIAAGISIAIIAVVNGLGTSLNAKFKSISTQLK
jgi:pilus assembly protein Flp/PilA